MYHLAPDGAQFSCVPQASAIPEHLAGPTPPGFFWASYEAIFPSDFHIAAETQLERGEKKKLGACMERLWSQAGATGGNRSQMEAPRKRLNQADRQPVATHGQPLRSAW